MKAVITADIVNSTKIEEAHRYLLVDELDNIIQDFQRLSSLHPHFIPYIGYWFR